MVNTRTRKRNLHKIKVLCFKIFSFGFLLFFFDLKELVVCLFRPRKYKDLITHTIFLYRYVSWRFAIFFSRELISRWLKTELNDPLLKNNKLVILFKSSLGHSADYYKLKLFCIQSIYPDAQWSTFALIETLWFIHLTLYFFFTFTVYVFKTPSVKYRSCLCTCVSLCHLEFRVKSISW